MSETPSSRARPGLAFPLAIAVWVVAVLVAYLVANPEYRWYAWNARDLVRRIAPAWLDHARAVGAALGLAGAAIPVGMALRPVRRVASADAVLGIATALAIGLSVVGLVAYGGAVVFRLSGPRVAIGLVALAGLGLAAAGRETAAALRESGRALRGAGTLRRPGLALAIALGVIHAAVALAPPRGTDSTWGHLSYALRIAGGADPLDASAYVEQPDLPNLVYYPNLVHGVFAAGMALAGIPGAALVCPLLFAAGLVLVHRLAGELGLPGGRTGQDLAAFLYAANLPVGIYATKGYLDVPFATFCLLAALLAIRWVREREPSIAGLALVAAAASAATRQQGSIVLALLAIGLVAAPTGWREGRWRSILGWGALALVWVLPWFVRNLVLTGNPVYPVFASVPLAGWAEKGFGHPPSLRSFLLLPYHLVFHENDFVVPAAAGIHLALLPTWFAARRSRPAVVLLALSFLYAVSWWLTIQSGRYLMPGLAVACAFSGPGLSRLLDSGRVARLAGAFAIVAVAGSSAAVFVAGSYPYDHRGLLQTAPVLAGLQSRDDYLAANHPPFAAVDFLNRLEPRPVVLLEEGVADSLWFDPDLPLETWAGRAGGEADYLRRLRSSGVTHVFVAEGPAERAPAWRREAWGEPVLARNGYRIYRLTP